MPRNRLSTPRDHRVTEIVAAARELFLSRGFTKTPMTEIAKAVGVANAAVYWYFPTKDDLLAAVFNRGVDEEIERLASGPEDPFERLMEGLAHLRPYRQLHMSIHDRMSDSDAVEVAHDRFIGWIRETVTEGLRYHSYEGEDVKDVAELVVVLFEGTHAPGVRARLATDVIKLLLGKLDLRPGGVARSRDSESSRATMMGPT